MLTTPHRAAGPRFILGVHRPTWLEDPRFGGIDLMVSANTLGRYAASTIGAERQPMARTWWALDSGGFSELRDHGAWRMGGDEFGGMITRLSTDFGAAPAWCSIQDWMCEDAVIHGGYFGGEPFVGTGLSVAIHQELTLDSYLHLSREFYFLPWLPILQGRHLEDYLAHVEAYAAAGVDLTQAPLVGLGSVCRRQATIEVERIVVALAGMGLRLHGFGVKTSGLARYGRHLVSADSMAWSLVARRERIRLSPDCPHPGICNNCPDWALAWRDRVLDGRAANRVGGRPSVCRGGRAMAALRRTERTVFGSARLRPDRPQ